MRLLLSIGVGVLLGVVVDRIDRYWTMYGSHHNKRRKKG
jgi:hypothetical protein